ncbi:helix-turn-helix transcriptional regulator [Nocardia inohanensis]|uniref:helix-turn-helix transcriptional regulator n=1 Tax=Nocardia inohanensis TaxID=209246 RepID=UPI0008366C56|nr:AAA family ATPase [Nocardia inohanensis]
MPGGDELIGRDAELGRLRVELAAALAGRSRMVLCSGEAGIGKTRLLGELAREAADAEVPVLWARSVELPDSPPFWLWRQVMGESGVADTLSESGDAPERALLFERIATWLDDLTAAHGALLVVDDIQWADEPSLDALLHLVRSLRRHRLLICAAERTAADTVLSGWRAVRPRLLPEADVETVLLQGLSRTDTATYLSRESGRDLPGSLLAQAHALTAGNPFYIRELARGLRHHTMEAAAASLLPPVAPNSADGTAAASTAVEFDPDALERGPAVTASPTLSTLDVPPRLTDIVTVRISMLAERTQEFLCAAAVLGQEFEIAVAARLVERSTVACLPEVEEAVRAGVLAATPAAGRAEFVHGLVRSVLVAGLPLPRRTELHRRAALTIEELYADCLDPHLADLARHWSMVAATGDRAPAVAWCTRAAEYAFAQLDFDAAHQLYELALSNAAEALSASTRGRLTLAKAEAAFRAGRLTLARQYCGDVVHAARRTGDPVLLAAAALTLEPIGRLGWDRDIRDWCEVALAALPLSGRAVIGVNGRVPAVDPLPSEGSSSAGVAGDCRSVGELRARLVARRTEAAVCCGTGGDAEVMSAAALIAAERGGGGEAVVDALRSRQCACGGPEFVEEGARLARRLIEIGVREQRPEVELRGRLWAVEVYGQRGRLDRVDREIVRMGWCVERVGGPVARWQLVRARGGMAQARGEFEDALRFGREAFETLEPGGHPRVLAYAGLVTLVGHHYGHRPELVGELLARADGEVRAELFVLLAPAWIAADQGRLDVAEHLFRRAGPPAGWDVPDDIRLAYYAVGVQIAAAVGDLDAVRFFHGRLSPWRGRHITCTAGYFGPVELTLATCAIALGEWDKATAELTAAADACALSGAAAHAVETACAQALVAHHTGDHAAATAFAEPALHRARALGMTDWAERLHTLLRIPIAPPAHRCSPVGQPGSQVGFSGSPVAHPGWAVGQSHESARPLAESPLSEREWQVALLVAAGATNRAIARELVISERTAQNHVQHILTKLGFGTRSRIAAWVTAQR